MQADPGFTQHETNLMGENETALSEPQEPANEESQEVYSDSFESTTQD